MIANIVLSVWLLVVLFSYLLVAIYCRIMKRRAATKTERVNKQVVVVSRSEDINSANKHKASVLKVLWKKADPYLYGLTRYLSIVTGKIPSERIRKILLRRIFCMVIDNDAVVYGGFEIRSPWNIKIGRAIIGMNALLDGRNGIIIEDDVVLATGVNIYTVQHDVNDPMFQVNDKGGRVLVRRHAWISSHTTILPKIEIGEGAVLSAGAVATKPLESFGIYAGIPARKRGDRTQNLLYEVGSNYWHFY